MSDECPDQRGFFPVDAEGARYWVSHHAADRALEVGLPLAVLPDFIRNGRRIDAPEGSKYKGSWVIRNGQVCLAVTPDPSGDLIITSVLPATAEAWRKFGAGKGRVYRGDKYIQSVLSKWEGNPTQRHEGENSITTTQN